MSEALLQYEVLVLVMYRALVKGYCLFHSTFAVCQGCRGWSEHGQVEASQEAAALAPSTFAELEVVHNLLIVFPCFQVPVTVICSSWGREEKLFNVKIREMHSACVLSLCWDEISQPGLSLTKSQALRLGCWILPLQLGSDVFRRAWVLSSKFG